jgi:hypothetical protein
MPQDQNKQSQGNPRDEDIREMQDKALETPGYADDPHIESSNRTADYTAEESSEDAEKTSGGGQ